MKTMALISQNTIRFSDLKVEFIPSAFDNTKYSAEYDGRENHFKLMII